MLGERGITTPRTQIKWAEGGALQGVRSRDLAGTDLSGARTRYLKGVRTRILAGTHAECAGGTRIQAHTCDNGTSVGIIWSKIPMRVQYEKYLRTVAYTNRPNQ